MCCVCGKAGLPRTERRIVMKGEPHSWLEGIDTWYPLSCIQQSNWSMQGVKGAKVATPYNSPCPHGEKYGACG